MSSRKTRTVAVSLLIQSMILEALLTQAWAAGPQTGAATSTNAALNPVAEAKFKELSDAVGAPKPEEWLVRRTDQGTGDRPHFSGSSRPLQSRFSCGVRQGALGPTANVTSISRPDFPQLPLLASASKDAATQRTDSEARRRNGMPPALGPGGHHGQFSVPAVCVYSPATSCLCARSKGSSVYTSARSAEDPSVIRS